MSTIDTISASGRTPTNNWSILSSHSNGGLASLPVRIFGLIEMWQARRKSRIALSRLTERELADIGISKSQAAFESNKPFWQSAENRMR